MRNKFTILRNVAAAPTTDPFSPNILAGIAGQPEAVARPKVESAELSMQEVLDVSRDPTVVGIAPSMPTKLIQLAEPEEKTKAPESAAQAQTAWGIKAVKADVSQFTGNGVVVSVLDTGIDKNHPAFQGVQLIEKDFSGSGNGDQHGHGTHCAGTIFGRDVGGTRIGVARGVKKALIGKVLNDQGGGDSDMLFRGMQWAQQEGANIISMSLGFDFPGFVDRLTGQGYPVPAATSIALEGYRANLRMFDAIMNLFKQAGAFGPGLLVVAASGNESNRDGSPPPAYEIAVSVPAAAQDVVAVGAIAEGQNGYTIAPFSNTFPQVSGPGVNVLSAKRGGGLVAFNGTSMATPHVAGVAALWWEKRSAVANNKVADAVRAELLASARDDVFKAGTDPADFGFGLVTSPA